MPKIILDKSKCIGCGACQAVCPKYFELGQDGKSKLKKGKSNSDKEELEIDKVDCVQEAAESCPTQCISIKKP